MPTKRNQSLVVCTIGGFPVLIPGCLIITSNPKADVSIIPGTRDWIIGSARHARSQVPVFDIARYFNPIRKSLADNAVLLIARYHEDLWALAIDRFLTVIDVSDVEPTDVKMLTPFHEYSLGTFVYRGQAHVFLNIPELLDAAAEDICIEGVSSNEE